MPSVNKAIILGHLGKDPETRYLPNGDAVTNVSIATSESWKDKQTGEKKESVEWHKVSFFGRLAEVAGEYLKKGALVYVEGKITTRKWQDKDGNDRYTTEIRADNMKMLGGRDRQTEQPAGGPKQDQRAPAKNTADDGLEDDIPFASSWLCHDSTLRKLRLDRE